MLLIFEAVRYSIVDYTRDKFWAIGTHTRVTHNTQRAEVIVRNSGSFYLLGRAFLKFHY